MITPSLQRRLGTADAVFIGLGSMIGAGVFAAFTPAAQAAGAGLLIGLLVAAAVAVCNALASAQLAATCPISGGAYVYGGEQLGSWWGFLAGWSFVQASDARASPWHGRPTCRHGSPPCTRDSMSPTARR